MPTYQYRCKDCGASLEAVQGFAEPALTECPTCGGTLRKVFSSVGVVFKGSGFYRTDSRDKPDSADSEPKPKPKADTKAEGGAEPTSATKSDPKSEPKSEPKGDSGGTTASPTKSSDTSSAA